MGSASKIDGLVCNDFSPQARLAAALALKMKALNAPAAKTSTKAEIAAKAKKQAEADKAAKLDKAIQDAGYKSLNDTKSDKKTQTAEKAAYDKLVAARSKMKV